jgi:hypothetical protein
VKAEGKSEIRASKPLKKARNPKAEAPKETRKPKPEELKIRISLFGFPSVFELRTSGLVLGLIISVFTVCFSWRNRVRRITLFLCQVNGGAQLSCPRSQ